MRASGTLKSATAFRTISEVSTDLDVPQHVLRFWEGKFPQIRPLKRGGGRRYYRPEDVDLLRRIQSLLYREGYTIRGAQRLLQGDGPDVDPQHFPPDLDPDLEPDGEPVEDEAEGRAAVTAPADIHDLDINPVLLPPDIPSADRLDPAHRHVLTELLGDLREMQRLVAGGSAKK